MPKFEPRRGLAAIEEAAAAKGSGSGSFRPFVPEISWREDNEKKYILVLTPIEEVATLSLHEWVPVGKAEKANGESYTKYESFLSRKDVIIGEDYDDLEDRLDRKPKDRCYGVAVELEPIFETVRGRQRPKGFTVKTDSYTRKTEDGEQEVVQPLIGLLVQSAQLMWSPLGSADQSQGPLSLLPIEVTRRGKDRNTRYDFIPFPDAPVDLSPIIDNLDGISYLKDRLPDVLAAAEAADDDLGAAQAVADALYNARLEELADKERYDEFVAPIDEIPDRFGSKKNATDRPKRPSPRKAAKEVENDSVEESVEPPKADRFAALKAKIEAK